jgi:hypothetical protein
MTLGISDDPNADAATFVNLINAVDEPEMIGNPNSVLSDWKILISPDGPRPESGFFAATFYNVSSGQIVIAFSGPNGRHAAWCGVRRAANCQLTQFPLLIGFRGT